ncbi:MAG: Gfo/Idh/MocA family oxidoreductase [Planctomycetes bacterium]|nr:Gfo/Idh/MocA family oxidoreductase [Planctomycetota bacterium]
MAKRPSSLFKNNKRIRLGIWGLGRGMSFYKMCSALNMDVVAGCDFNPHMRESFLRDNPGALATGDATEFLASDIDAVLLATFCPDHAGDAIRCLEAGKHVLSEVTSFHTVAEGVALVEAVERTGKVYNLAENYPFSASNMWLKQKWKEGLFGELQYGEFEYLHEIRSLAYTYIDGVPIAPGGTMHSWRSWLDYHYYCTHSLGPIMQITGTRPTRVVSLPGSINLAGYPVKRDRDGGGLGGVAPSLITMDNGAIVRNLMGATTGDGHVQRLWGTRGSAFQGVHSNLSLRLGGAGHSPIAEVRYDWPELGEVARTTGHGGGDFWVLYYFARQILSGEPAPWDVYASADVTLPGILAWRSAKENGQAYDVPDLRKKKDRDAWRNDHTAPKRPDNRTHLFGKAADPSVAGYNATMRSLIGCTLAYRAWADWGKVAGDLVRPAEFVDIVRNLVVTYAELRTTYAEARRLIDANPGTEGARAMRELLEDIGGERAALAKTFLPALRRQFAKLERTVTRDDGTAEQFACSPLAAKAKDIRKAAPPKKSTRFAPVPVGRDGAMYYADARAHHGGKDGLLYLRTTIAMKRAGKGKLLYGSDGPVRVWVNGKAVDSRVEVGNPIRLDSFNAATTWKKGANAVVFAVNTNNGNAWGVCARGALDG